MKKYLLVAMLLCNLKMKAQAPVNDNCSGALAVMCNIPLAGNTTTATDDVLPVVSCGSDSYGSTRAVWYKITAATSGTVIVKTCNTTWDTYLRVYQGTCTNLNTCVAYDDDACAPASELSFSGIAGVTYFIMVGGFDGDDFGPFSLTVECGGGCFPPSVVSATDITLNSATINWANTGTYVLEYGLPGFTPGTGAVRGGGIAAFTSVTSPRIINSLQPATNYEVYIRKECAGGFYSTNSPAVAFTTAPPAPSNDDCFSAYTIGPVPLAATSAGATQTTAPVVCSGFTSSAAKDVWFTFTAPVHPNSATYPVTVKVDNAAGFDPVLQIYGGTCSGLNEIDCSDITGLNGIESITFSATNGETYLVRVYGYSGGTGTFNVAVCTGRMNITSPSTNLCDGSSITITGSVPGGNYEWYRDGDIIPGANAATFAAVSTGEYFAKAYVNNCEIISNTIYISTQLAPQPDLASGPGIYAENALVDFNIVSTQTGSQYRLKKVGSVIPVNDPPMNGNGSNQSINFVMNSASKAGDYYLEVTRSGMCMSTSSYMEVGFGGVTGLKLDNCPFDSVEFSWNNYYNSVQRFRYIVSEWDLPNEIPDTTDQNNVVFHNLLPGKEYFIHVSGATIPGGNLNNIAYSDNWKTISFRTPSAPISTGYCEWSGKVNTDWHNADNWICGAVPQSVSNVEIPSNLPNYPTISSDKTFKSLKVHTGASVTVLNGAHITLTQ